MYKNVDCKLNKNKLLEMYQKMVTIRHFEERAEELYMAGKITPVHLSIGQEACAVGACAALREDDYITTTHRGHHHCIAKGADIKRMMAELYSKKTGYCKGKGGSMHLADFNKGIYGAYAIVGANIPIATGIGFAIKYKGTDQVVICFFGDGATNQGTFHESLNMAAIWKLPVIYLCENNQYAISTHVSRAFPTHDIAVRAEAYGIPGKVVDGNDVLAVYEAVAEAVDRARTGGGPTLVEAKTYRIKGHFAGEEFAFPSYRSRDEIETWKTRDPINLFRNKLIQMGVLSESEDKRIMEEVKLRIEEAIKFAEESPSLEFSDLFDDLWV